MKILEAAERLTYQTGIEATDVSLLVRTAEGVNKLQRFCWNRSLHESWVTKTILNLN